MNKDAYYAGVRQALYDAGISVSGQEKQASDPGVIKQAGRVQALEEALMAALGRGRSALSSGKEFIAGHPVSSGAGVGAGLGALTGGLAGGDLESALIGAGAGAGLGALGGGAPSILARLRALRAGAR